MRGKMLALLKKLKHCQFTDVHFDPRFYSVPISLFFGGQGEKQ